MALTDLTRLSTSGIATGTSLSGAILHGDAHFRGDQVGINSAIFDSSERRLDFKDNVKLRFGDSGDLQLQHNGSDSVISQSAAGTGNLKILSGGAQSIECVQAGAVNIAHNGSTKIQTTSTGTIVTGVLTATSFSGKITGDTTGNIYAASGISTVYNLRVSNDLTVEGTTTTIDTNLIGVDRVEVGANSNTTVAVSIAQTGTADIINLFDGTTEVLTVTDGGKVGIGTVDPGSPLEVSGGTALDTATFNTHHANGVLINLQRSGTSKGFLGSGKNIADATGGVDDIGLRSNANLIFTSGGGIERARFDTTGVLKLYGDNGNNSLIYGHRSGNLTYILGNQSGTDHFNIKTWRSSSDIIFSLSGNNEKVRITSAGRVGINTNNPLSGFHISDGTAYGTPQNASKKATLIISAGSEGSSDIQLLSANYNHIFFGDSADANTGIIWYEHTGAATDSMHFSTAGTERLRIASDSNITQTIDSDGDGFIITAGSENIKPMLTGISNRGAVNNTIFGISGKWSSNEVGRIAFEAGADTTNKDDGKINLYTRPSGGSLTSRLLIDSVGAVGINESSPTGKLTITEDPQGFCSDSAQPEATLLIKHGTTGTNRRWVGIGASLTGAWLQSSSPGGSGLAAPLWINKGGGDVTLGSDKLTVASGGAVSIAVGDLTLTDGNLVVASGHGIDFSATGDGNGTMGDELLDDYEQGTWSPTIYGGTTAGDYSYQANRTGGKYTKIGNLVYIEGVLRIETINSAGAGDLYMGGLPYSTSAPMASAWTIGKGVQFFMYGTSGNTTASIAEPPFTGTASGGASAFNIRSYGKNLNVMPQIEDFDNQWWIFQVAGWYPVN